MRARDVAMRLCFAGHYGLCLYVLVPVFRFNTPAALLVLLSWELNDDFCVVSQWEEACFGQTFLLRPHAKRVTRWEKAAVCAVQGVKLVVLNSVCAHTSDAVFRLY